MYYKLNVTLDEKNCKVFLQHGFYSMQKSSNSTHKHNYTEIHLISGGNATFKVGTDVITVGDGEIIVIPRGFFHSWEAESPDMLHTAFQIDTPCECPEVIAADPYVIKGFFNEIDKSKQSNDLGVISAYIPLLCSYVIASHPRDISEVTDEGMLIEVFFSTSYNKDVQLSDLAAILHLSERQTERKLIEHTGHTFREELAATRISVAKYLQSTSSMSLSEIATYVGYHSYAGFWKAMKKDFSI